ncbi:uncharacterized protein LOC113099148 [Carassius auratus]|uniref:Uncharacterized protein LOC113099148 n=1 Tax=Carassius auratus TaxID=7957 RepID=A0A6P6PEX5_CARAU|nr:uncharacterized protein LOC113099148 [Carassius auratus]
MTAERSQHYGEVKKEILSRVGLSPICAAQQFHDWEYRARQPARAQAAELSRLAQHWLLTGGPSAHQVAERVVIDRFLRALPRALRQAAGMRNPTDLDGFQSPAGDNVRARGHQACAGPASDHHRVPWFLARRSGNLKEPTGVFGVETNKVKSVSVKKGDSIILNNDFDGIHTYDKIEWRFVQLRIAVIKKAIGNNPQYDDDERFRDRLKLDQTGSLTITDTRTTDSGLYKLSITIKNHETIKKFNVTVYAHLPVPVISRNSSHCSSSSSSSCSVVNVSQLTFSWFKGNSLLSSISVSDLSISLSLPLEVEYQDNNTYSCVINNSFTKQSTHLNISKLCQTCSGM